MEYAQKSFITMPYNNLGKMMDGREPAQSPSPSFEERRTTQTYFNYGELTPQRLKTIFQLADNRGRIDMLYRLYDDMEHTDTRYSGILNQLRSTIARMPIRVLAAEGRTKKEEQLAEEYQTYAHAVLNRIDSHSLTQEFAEPYIRGAAFYSIDWEIEGLPYNRRMWIPSDVTYVNGKHLIEEVNTVDDRQGEMKVRTKKDPTGEFVADLPFDNHIFLESRQGKGRYSRIGVARKITPWYLALRFVKTWWVQYLENYGSPLRIGKYPRGSKKSKRQKMKKFLRKLGSNGYGLFPSGMDIDMIDLNRQGKVNVHREFIREAHQEYSIHILGQAGTTGEGREGSYAQSVVLNGIRLDIVQNVAQIVSKGFEKLIRKGLRLNYGDNFSEHLVPEIKPILLNSQDAQQRAKAAQILSDIGLPVPQSYAYNQVLGTERPKTGEKAIKKGELVEIGSKEEEMANGESPSGESGENEPANQGDESVVNNPNRG
jgi:phage gp29-like protein